MKKLQFPLIDQMRTKRLSQNLSMRALAKKIGVSYSTLARLERDEGGPTIETAERIERWLTKDEPSPPRVVTPGAEPWHLKIERRLAAIEAQLAAQENGVYP